MANFRTRARAVDLLGKQQIRDEVTAISELLRNSYDADADEGLINVDSKKDRIIVWDDGDGMTENDLQNNWLTLGTYSKKKPIPQKTDKGRIKIGEKGIGRLAISLLGDQLLLISKIKAKLKNEMKTEWSLLFLHWELFRNENLYLEEINVPIKSFENLDDLQHFLKHNFDNLKEILLNNIRDESKWDKDIRRKIKSDIEGFHISEEILNRLNTTEKRGGGTLFYVSNLDNAWDWGIYNSQIEEENLKKRKRRLQDILFSFQNFIDIYEVDNMELNLGNSNFEINEMRSDKFSPKIHVNGRKLENEVALNPDDIKLYDYALKGTITNGEFNGNAFFGDSSDLEDVVVDKKKLTKGMFSDTFKDCGPIKIKWFFLEGKSSISSLPKEQHVQLSNKLNEIGGIYVFRDGLRILPYGEQGNDFLEMEERRTKRAGRYLFSFRRMYGYIEISKNGNEYLVDKSSREGFIENGEFNYFRTILINLLLWWAEDYLGTTEKYNGKRSLYTQKMRDEREKLIKERDKKKLEEINEKLYFRTLNRYLDGFTASKENLRILIKKNIDNILRKFEVEKTSDQKLIDLKLNLYSELERFGAIKYEYNPRYEHSTEELEIIIQYEEELKETESELQSYIEKIINKLNSSYVEKEKLNQHNEEVLFSKLNEIISNDIPSLFNKFELIKANKTKVLNDQLENTQNHIKNMVDTEIEKYGINYKLLIVNLKERANKLKENYINNNISNESEYREIYNEILDAQKSITDIQTNINSSEYINMILKQLSTFNINLIQDSWSNDNEYIGLLKKEINLYRDLSAVGLAAELTGHEFNSLYGSIKDALKILSLNFKNTKSSLIINNIIRSFVSLEKLYERVSPLYKQSRYKRKSINIHEFLNNILEYFSSDIKRYDVKVINDIPKDFIVIESETVIFTPLVNLISNAIYWMLNQGERKLYFYISDDRNNLFIHDTGPGIEEKDIINIFEPFFTKRIGGRGIGLFLSRDILSSKGHDLNVLQDKNKPRSINGACFTIKFNQKSVVGG